MSVDYQRPDQGVTVRVVSWSATWPTGAVTGGAR